MFDHTKFQTILKAYKQVFTEQQWPDEKYKWIAIKHFQDNWDINADNFQEMWLEATNKTSNLLASQNNYPRAMIRDFAQADPEATRSMFVRLFDESQNLFERVTRFIADSNLIRETYNPGSWTQHYQNMNTVTTYLWLHFPDKYFIYKYSEIRNITKSLGSSFSPKTGTHLSNLDGFLQLYNSMCELISKDTELTDMLKSSLTDDCYPDPYFKTLTVDFGYFTSRRKAESKQEKMQDWFPSDYHPGLRVEDWVDLLNDPEVFTRDSRTIVARFKDYGGSATCTQLAIKYGKPKNYYNAGSTHLARRIQKKRDVPLHPRDDESLRLWPILFTGKYAAEDEEGYFIWKLRDELNQALDHFRWQDWVSEKTPEEQTEISYWWLNANPRIWSVAETAIGESQSYSVKNENGNYRRIPKNFRDAKPDDLIVIYESYPTRQIVALARITDETNQDDLFFEKTEMLSNPIPLSEIQQTADLSGMEYFRNPQGSLFKLTKEEFNVIMDLIREQNPKNYHEPKTPYTKENFLSTVYLEEEQYDSLVQLVKNKKNVILMGAPGTGKTFSAKRLAYSIIGEKKDYRIEMVQFHQNYSYEDFMMGYRPSEDGFELRQGIFYRFCTKVSNEPSKDFFLIIDEINRGNLSKIFGELLMLIENDHRGEKVTLAYNGQPFSVPKNLYIIGLMNTADRSLAMIDYALRRRFSFFEMDPAFNRPRFREYQKELDNERFDNLIEIVIELNRSIETDKSLGKGFCIGHSYFCGQEECKDEWLYQVVNYEILPMLREYWFDEPIKWQEWERKLTEVLND